MNKKIDKRTKHIIKIIEKYYNTEASVDYENEDNWLIQIENKFNLYIFNQNDLILIASKDGVIKEIEDGEFIANEYCLAIERLKLDEICNAV